MVLVLLERKLKTKQPERATSALADEIRERRLYYQIEGGFADASQVGARAKQYPALFSTGERNGRKTIVLNELPRQVVANVVATDS